MPIQKLSPNFEAPLGVEANNYQYNNKELNEDFGLQWMDYGARWYNPQINLWGQIDPMAEKYFGFSPYVYVGNNPIIRIDKDGRDWDTVIDHNEKTITIKANFSTLSGSIAEQTLQAAVTDWNAQSGKFNYVIGEGNNAISYSVNFNLTANQFQEGVAENMMTVLPDNAKVFQERIEKDVSGNELTIKPQGVSNGVNFSIKESNSSNVNVVSHEIGHNLGMNHTGSGIMKSTTGGKSLKEKNVTENLGHSQVGKVRKNSTVNARLKSRIETGTAPSEFQNGKIIENKNWNNNDF